MPLCLSALQLTEAIPCDTPGENGQTFGEDKLFNTCIVATLEEARADGAMASYQQFLEIKVSTYNC